MHRSLEVLVLLLLGSVGLTLIAWQLKSIGWSLLVLTTVLLPFCRRDFAKDIFLICLTLVFLGLTPITTDISYGHVAVMGLMLFLAVATPYAISRFVFRDHHIRFRWHHGRRWTRREIVYIAITAIVSYLLLPYYLRSTGAYANWTVEPGAANIFRFFLGTNVLGIWDELFFVNTVLATFRRHWRFSVANLAQGVFFTSFLYELGFSGWGPLMIYPFALIQGYVWKKTDSLLFVVALHLTYDFVLFLALLHAHHPDWVPIFLT